MAAILFLLWRGTVQQRRLRRALFGVLFAYPGEGIVDSVGGWFSSIGSDVKDFVLSAIRAAADLIWGALGGIASLLSAVQNAVLDVYTAAINFATSLFNQALAFANTVFWHAVDVINTVAASVRDFAVGLFNEALDFANSVFWHAVDVINSVAASVRDFAVGLYNQALDFANSVFWHAVDVINTVAAAVRDFAVAVVNEAVSLLHDVIFAGLDALRWALTTIIDNAKAALHVAIDDAATALHIAIDVARSEAAAGVNALNDYVFGPAQAIIGVIETVVDWLISLASFPFTTARDIWEAFRQTGGRHILTSMPDSVNRWGAHIAGHATTYVNTDHFDYQLPAMPTPPGGGSGGGGGVVGPGVGTPDRLAFGAALFAALGAPNTPSNMAFFVAWATHEGTSASFNPLATTLDYGSNTRFNSVGVRNYADFQTGVAATAQTLIGSGYPGIVAALRSGDGHAAGQVHGELSRWSGGGYDTINV